MTQTIDSWPRNPGKSNGDRRAHARFPLTLRVKLFNRTDDREGFEVTTSNISSGGFYCVCEHRFTHGKRMDCLVEVWDSGSQPGGGLGVPSRVRVVRVELAGMEPELMGVAFKMENC